MLPFLIRHQDGREFELAGDKAGIAAYRDQYMHQGFAIVDPQPTGYERPDLSEPKGKPKAKDTPAEDRPISQKDANAAVARVHETHEAAVKRADKG